MLFSLLKILQSKSPWKPWFYRILVEWPPLIEGSRHRRYCVTSSNWQTKRWPSQIQLSIFHLFYVDSHWSVVAKLTLEASQITAAANDDFLFFQYLEWVSTEGRWSQCGICASFDFMDLSLRQPEWTRSDPDLTCGVNSVKWVDQKVS